MIHVFEKAGLGIAPFTCIGVVSIPSPSMAETNPLGYSEAMKKLPQGAGSCKYCGMPLIHNYIIKDSQGKTFMVGCECVNKTGDTGLIRETSIIKKEREKVERNKKAALKRKEELEKKAAILKEKQDAFIMKHPGELYFLLDRKDANFFLNSLYNNFKSFGSLTQGQMAALTRVINEMTAPTIPSEYVGIVGERITRKLVFIKKATFQVNQYHYNDSPFMHIYSLKDEQGNVFVVKSKSHYDLTTNQTYQVTGTIKSHNIYQDVKQTQLQRIRVK